MNRDQQQRQSSQDPTICRMKASEAEDVTILFRKVLASVPYYNDQAKAAERKKYTPSLLEQSVGDDPSSVLIARIGHKAVGYCFSRKDDGLIWLSWFGVHPAYRQSGIGSCLLKGLEERARAAGAHKIWCDCRTNNTESRVTLIRHNFQPLCTVPNHWHRQDFILWEKYVD